MRTYEKFETLLAGIFELGLCCQRRQSCGRAPAGHTRGFRSLSHVLLFIGPRKWFKICEPWIWRFSRFTFFHLVPLFPCLWLCLCLRQPFSFIHLQNNFLASRYSWTSIKVILQDCNCKRNACSTESSARGYRARQAWSIEALCRIASHTKKHLNPYRHHYSKVSLKRNARSTDSSARGIRARARHPRASGMKYIEALCRMAFSHQERFEHL